MKLAGITLAGYLIYANYDRIRNALDSLQWYGSTTLSAAQGRQPESELAIITEKRTDGKLEAYLVFRHEKVPLQLRAKGPLLRSPEYHFNVLTNMEKEYQCFRYQQDKEDRRQSDVEGLLRLLSTK